MDKRGIDRDRIKPEFMTALVEPIEEVYTAIRHDLCVKLAAAFNDKTLKSQGNAWRSTMLARLGSFTRSTIALIASYSGDVSRETKNAIRSAVRAGIDACEPELLQLHPGGYIPDPEPTMQRVTEMYVAQALESCNMVNTVMLNSTLRQYKKIVDDVTAVDDMKRRLAYDQEELNAETGAVILGAKSRQEAVHDAVVNMARNGITGFIDKAGREWSPDAYVNMDIRTTAAAAAREAVFERNEEYGNNLISVSAHAGARPLCYPYQGKVYSTDGTSGTVKDGHGNSIEYSPLSITSYGEPGGLFGINCGHFNYPFIPDISIVRADVQPEAENREQYLRNQQQRAKERAIRNMKTEADALEAAGFTDDAKALRKRIREKNAELKDWCEENGQDYKPDRLRVTRAVEKPEELKIQSISDVNKITQSINEVHKIIQSQSTSNTVGETKADSISDVTKEYSDNATPGKGNIIFEDGYKKNNHSNEIACAEFLHSTYGGDITLLAESKERNHLTPDFLWKNRMWEHKTVSSNNSAYKNTQKALHQIKENPGGIVIDFSNATIAFHEIEKSVSDRLKRSGIDADVIFIDKTGTVKIIRYKKQKALSPDQ